MNIEQWSTPALLSLHNPVARAELELRGARRPSEFWAARAHRYITGLANSRGAVPEDFNLRILVDVLSDKSCGSKNFMSQNLIYYTSLKRSNWVELIGVKFGPNGLIWPELWRWPVKVLQIGARKLPDETLSGPLPRSGSPAREWAAWQRQATRKWALQSCSRHNWSKIFTASYFSCFFG